MPDKTKKKVELIAYKPKKNKRTGYHGGWGSNNDLFKKRKNQDIVIYYRTRQNSQVDI
jgi:hypothetical protein